MIAGELSTNEGPGIRDDGSAPSNREAHEGASFGYRLLALGYRNITSCNSWLKIIFVDQVLNAEAQSKRVGGRFLIHEEHKEHEEGF